MSQLRSYFLLLYNFYTRAARTYGALARAYYSVGCSAANLPLRGNSDRPRFCNILLCALPVYPQKTCAEVGLFAMDGRKKSACPAGQALFCGFI